MTAATSQLRSSIADAIRRLLMERSMTVEELAETADVAPERLQAGLAHTASFNIEEIWRVAGAFGMSASWFVEHMEAGQ